MGLVTGVYNARLVKRKATDHLGLKLAVEHVDAQAVSNAKQACVHLGQLVHRFNLLIQKVLLQMVRQMGIFMSTRNFVQAQQGLQRLTVLLSQFSVWSRSFLPH